MRTIWGVDCNWYLWKPKKFVLQSEQNVKKNTNESDNDEEHNPNLATDKENENFQNAEEQLTNACSKKCISMSAICVKAIVHDVQHAHVVCGH